MGWTNRLGYSNSSGDLGSHHTNFESLILMVNPACRLTGYQIKTKMKNTILIVSMVLVSFGAFAQHDHGSHDDKKGMGQKMEPMFKDKDLGIAYGHYIHLKEALVASQTNEGRKAATKLETSLGSVDYGQEAKTEAANVVSATTLDGQRKAFASLSNEMSTLVKGGELSMGEVYLEYCPMANNNAGAYWLSNQKEIKNPYFGDKMLKCGSVKETIN
ncbi:DUF3347 domain-containing protein [Cyclobacterium sp.]|jgi:hypothetical protein|uniref:DUF3347 domain-containing protein n=1 Tax=Cyclobacterium sp. TaxID=1966343 RepID=UPI0019B059F6|nr:DUF3347 domain-containing protein [Cyclobacterium sp.]MBD3627735.1 DUF3347 domain-containing protein [Cyclobacterium sp.]